MSHAVLRKKLFRVLMLVENFSLKFLAAKFLYAVTGCSCGWRIESADTSNCEHNMVIRSWNTRSMISASEVSYPTHHAKLAQVGAVRRITRTHCHILHILINKSRACFVLHPPHSNPCLSFYAHAVELETLLVYYSCTRQVQVSPGPVTTRFGAGRTYYPPGIKTRVLGYSAIHRCLLVNLSPHLLETNTACVLEVFLE